MDIFAAIHFRGLNIWTMLEQCTLGYALFDILLDYTFPKVFFNCSFNRLTSQIVEFLYEASKAMILLLFFMLPLCCLVLMCFSVLFSPYVRADNIYFGRDA